MKPLASVIVFEPAASAAEVLRSLMMLEHGVHVRMTRDAGEARSLAKAEQADLVVVGPGVADADAMALAGGLREDLPVSDLTLLRVCAERSPQAREEALRRGFDGFLEAPVDAPAAVAALRAVMRLKRMRDEVERQRGELDRHYDAHRRDTDQVFDLLICLLETSLPGAADRGRRAAALSNQLAARFGVPERLLHDLEVASLLRELGSLSTHGDGESDEQGWRHGIATRSLLMNVDGMRGAGEIVGAMHENWDGTGLPDRRIAGQIPLRSRILRVVVDFLDEYEAVPRRPLEEVIERLREHVGTRYDPMVVVHLEALLQRDRDGARNPRVVVPVPALRVGMVLAEDLYTDSGLKLLARGTRLTLAALETIQRRHQMEPILHGAAVLREAA